MNYEAITNEMIEALGEEIEAIKKEGGSQQVGLQGGVQKGVVAGRFLYTFLLVSDLQVLDDTPALLKVGSQSYDVTVVGTEGFEVTIAVREDLGDRVPAASLGLSAYYLLELLQRRLREVLSGDLRVDKQMALRLFN